MRFVIITIFILAASGLCGQDVIELQKAGCPPLIGKSVSFYLDESSTMKMEEVRALSQDKFKVSDEELLNFNITKAAIWCSMKFTCREEADWLLEFKNSNNNRIDVYLFNKGRLVSRQYGGIPYPENVRKLLGGHVLFDLDMKAGDTLNCLLRTEGSGPMAIGLRASDTRSFFNEDHKFNLLHGMFYGIMLLMVLYNLFLYFTNRARVYIFYIFYIFFSTLFIAFFLGYIYVLPEFVLYFFSHFPVIVPAFFGLFGLLFSIEFLNTKKLAPKLHKAIRVFIMLVLLPIALAISGFPHESVAIIQVFGVILAVLSLATGITVLNKGYRPAKFYVIGFGAYMLGLMTLIVTNATHLSVGGFENYALETGSAIEAIMLSFAIGDKLNIANYEKQIAQGQTLEALKENEKLIREQNVVLETKVKERTAELEEQKDIVEEKNKEIVDSIRYAKRIQSTLLPSDKYIERSLERLKSNN